VLHVPALAPYDAAHPGCPVPRSPSRHAPAGCYGRGLLRRRLGGAQLGVLPGIVACGIHAELDDIVFRRSCLVCLARDRASVVAVGYSCDDLGRPE